jgi:hypothetical protein
LKHWRAMNKRRPGQIVEDRTPSEERNQDANPRMQPLPPPTSAKLTEAKAALAAAHAAVDTSQAIARHNAARSGLAADGDDAAGWLGGGPRSPPAVVETKNASPETSQVLVDDKITHSPGVPKPQVAAAGDDAAGREQPQAEAAMLTAQGHGGDAAAGGLPWVEKRSGPPKSIGTGKSAVGPTFLKTPSVPRFSEPAPLEGLASAERVSHAPPAGKSTTPVVASEPVVSRKLEGAQAPTKIATGDVSLPRDVEGAQASSNSAPPTLAQHLSGTSRAPSLPASPQPGIRSLGNIVSVAGMLSPSRLAGQRTVAPAVYGTLSPARMQSGTKAGNSSPQPARPVGATHVSGVGSAPSNNLAQAAQPRAQPPPALTPRQLNVGSFAPPMRAPAPTVPISIPPPANATTRSNSPRQLQPGAVSSIVAPTTKPRVNALGGVGETTSGGSFTAPVGKRKITVHTGAGGSFELPVPGALAANVVARSTSTSPSHRQRSPQPAARTGTPGRLVKANTAVTAATVWR